jgi:hypothetical protein
MININNSSVNKYQKSIFIVNSLISNNLELSFAKKISQTNIVTPQEKACFGSFIYIYINERPNKSFYLSQIFNGFDNIQIKT